MLTFEVTPPGSVRINKMLANTSTACCERFIVKSKIQMPSRVQELSPVNDEGVAGDKRSFVGNEEEHAIRDFLGSAHA
jgi:hypothetical protein